MKVLGEFVRTHGGIERRFTSSERRMLTNLAGGVVASLDTADEVGSYADPVVTRLLPVAYPDDPDAAAEYAGATRSRLAAAKSDAARRLVADLESAPGGVVHLDEAAAVRWLTALGDLRLALAERVGIEEVQRSVHTPQGMLYAWLTWLQGSLVEAVEAH
ncbi:MAG TPA: DUF2017 family protein [Amnibacterium sp.]|jgi:hypothetical protein|nr:DUF2017 family protein [Amnibacterium sp.]